MSKIHDPQNYVKAMIQCLFVDHSTVTKNWGIYLQDPKFYDELELRNKFLQFGLLPYSIPF